MFTKSRFDYTPANRDEKESVDETVITGRKKSKPVFSNWIFRVFLGILILLVAIFGILRIFHIRIKGSGLLPPGDFFPSFPQVLTKFADTYEYLRFDWAGDDAWNKMIPNGGGYVKVPHPRRYDIEKSVPLGINDPEESEVYQASIVHQLHCLGTLRNVLIAYSNGEVLNNKYDSVAHMSHCLNNIRQGILCAADTSLTYAHPTLESDGLYRGTFQGIGAVHTCRNWDAVKEFLIEHRAMDWNKTIGET